MSNWWICTAYALFVALAMLLERERRRRMAADETHQPKETTMPVTEHEDPMWGLVDKTPKSREEHAATCCSARAQEGRQHLDTCAQAALERGKERPLPEGTTLSVAPPPKGSPVPKGANEIWDEGTDATIDLAVGAEQPSRRTRLRHLVQDFRAFRAQQKRRR